MIAPGRRTGAYRVGPDSPIGDAIKAEDFAVALGDELEKPAHVGTRFTVADWRGERTSLRSSAPHTAGRCALISGDGEVRLLTALYIAIILCP